MEWQIQHAYKTCHLKLPIHSLPCLERQHYPCTCIDEFSNCRFVDLIFGNSAIIKILNLVPPLARVPFYLSLDLSTTQYFPLRISPSLRDSLSIAPPPPSPRARPLSPRISFALPIAHPPSTPSPIPPSASRRRHRRHDHIGLPMQNDSLNIRRRWERCVGPSPRSLTHLTIPTFAMLAPGI